MNEEEQIEDLNQEQENFLTNTNKGMSKPDLIKRKYLVTLLVTTAIVVFNSLFSILLIVMSVSSNLAEGFAIFLELLILIIELIIMCFIYSIGTKPFNMCMDRVGKILFGSVKAKLRGIK